MLDLVVGPIDDSAGDVSEDDWLMTAEHHRPKHGQAGAFLGLFALLLQAVLFAWHTHPLSFSAPGQALALSAPILGAPVSPAAVEDECQICLSLNHLSAAPVIAAELPPPPRIGIV